MKKNILIFVVILCLAVTCFAQDKPLKPKDLHAKHKNSSEIGLFLGGSYYIGDLNQTKQFLFTKPALGVVFRYNINPRLSARANILIGTIEGHDSYSGSASQQQRNLNFKSPIDEVSGQIEFNFFNYRLGIEKEKFTPYIFLGVGAFNFNPQGQLPNGNYVALQPLHTEGEGMPGGSMRKPYKLTQICIPFGVGIKTNIARKMCLTIEWGMRKTFTDYLDDVSNKYYDPGRLSGNAAYFSDPSKGTDPTKGNVGRQRGNPLNDDWYCFVGVILSFELRGPKEKCPGF